MNACCVYLEPGSDWNSMVLSMLRPRGPLEFYGLVLRKMITITPSSSGALGSKVGGRSPSGGNITVGLGVA